MKKFKCTMVDSSVQASHWNIVTADSPEKAVEMFAEFWKLPAGEVVEVRGYGRYRLTTINEIIEYHIDKIENICN